MKIKRLISLFFVFFSMISAGTVMNEDNMVVEQIYGDYELSAGDTLPPLTHVKVYMGNAKILGVVQGYLTVYSGNINIDSLAVIEGTVKSLGGEIFCPSGYRGNGEIIVSNLTGTSVRDFVWNPKDAMLSGRNRTAKPKKSFFSIFSMADPLASYNSLLTINTQQGFFIQIGDELQNMGNLERTSFYYKLGYGFSSKKVEGAAQLRIKFFENNPLYLYGMAYHETHIADMYHLPETENGFAYFLLKQDYNTRFMAEGYRLGGLFRFFNCFQVKGEYVYQNEYPLAIKHHNTLSINPSIKRVDSGRMTGYRFSTTLALGNDGMSLPGAFQIDALYETYLPSLGGSWDFDKIYLSSQYIGTIGHAIQYRNRVAVATLRDDQDYILSHPLQYEYTLGGMGTLRGIPYKSMQGQRMFLMNHELGVGNWDIWFFGFIDVGLTDAIIPGASLKKQLTDFKQNDWVSTLGFGIETGSTQDFGIRFDIAKDMSTSKAPWISYFRFSRTF
ncbi:MAG: hypothetical protein PHS99_02435 [Candidatus Marinimicrobia bacterium]|nr:hypothetical protein [Candidatus Neomarinimicrobiota bacterium]